MRSGSPLGHEGHGPWCARLQSRAEGAERRELVRPRHGVDVRRAAHAGDGGEHLRGWESKRAVGQHGRAACGR